MKGSTLNLFLLLRSSPLPFSLVHLVMLQQVPVFISGESLGGALSILLGLSLYETKVSISDGFNPKGL